MQQAASAEVVARKVLEACRRPHQIDGHELSLSCSIGISVYPDDAESKSDLLRAASDAVHAAKQVRHTWARYTQGDAPAGVGDAVGVQLGSPGARGRAPDGALPAAGARLPTAP